MTILAYILAVGLLLWSLNMAMTHLRPVPAYVLGLLRGPFDVILWRGFMLGPVVLLVSIYVCVRTLLDPSTFWLKATIILILIDIIAAILFAYSTYRITKPAYDQYEREQNY
jgi:hypothetical protein